MKLKRAASKTKFTSSIHVPSGHEQYCHYNEMVAYVQMGSRYDISVDGPLRRKFESAGPIRSRDISLPTSNPPQNSRDPLARENTPSPLRFISSEFQHPNRESHLPWLLLLLNGKPNQNHQTSQPSSIQHFFERHSQAAAAATSSSSNSNPSIPLNPQPDSNPNPPQSSPPPADPPPPCGEESSSQITPEISKSVSLKRFKFSPGMLIKQSRDDGGDEVTWKISPVNVVIG
uniref:Zinc finger homeobox protein 4-like n=1 Tax=Elaeis guineensis var. tenera TaxID=51953 RepID=A0A8N4IH45_ELAGV|nr:zinc finger homeobox protein 4-like [Elaeis guineensis]